MSTNILIEATVLDGSTVADLSGPDSQDANGIYHYSFPAAGIIDLETVPNISPSTPIWMQYGSVIPVGFINQFAEFTMDLYFPATGAVQNLFTSERWADAKVWNLLIPQKVRLKLVADDGQGGPQDGLLAISFWQFGSKEWPELQCCHKFGPYEPEPA